VLVYLRYPWCVFTMQCMDWKGKELYWTLRLICSVRAYLKAQLIKYPVLLFIDLIWSFASSSQIKSKVSSVPSRI
jgi:hypothetical protein